MLKLILILLLVIGLLVFAGYLYLNHWAKYFVDAIVERENPWFIEEGQRLLNPDEHKHFTQQEQEYADFWLQEDVWRNETTDRLNLVASAFRQPAGKTDHNWVICVHGYRSNGYQDVADLAKHYYTTGYQVLVPDLRAHGRSEGQIIGLGWLDRLDIISWIKEIIQRDPQARIILHGVSMGAAAILMASGERLPENVKLLIADSSYTSVYSEFKWFLRHLTKYPVNRFMQLANHYVKEKAGYSFLQASVTRQLGSNHLPVLFLHGSEDRFISVKETATLIEATAGEKQLHIFKGVGHLQAKQLVEKEYWQVIERFMQHYLPEKSGE